MPRTNAVRHTLFIVAAFSKVQWTRWRQFKPQSDVLYLPPTFCSISHTLYSNTSLRFGKERSHNTRRTQVNHLRLNVYSVAYKTRRNRRDVTLLARRAVFPWSYNLTECGMTSSPGLRGWSCLQARCGVLQTTTDDEYDRPLLVLSPTLCVGGPVITVRCSGCWRQTENRRTDRHPGASRRMTSEQQQNCGSDMLVLVSVGRTDRRTDARTERILSLSVSLSFSVQLKVTAGVVLR